MTDKRAFRLGSQLYLVLRRGFASDEAYEAEVQRLIALGAEPEEYPKGSA